MRRLRPSRCLTSQPQSNRRLSPLPLRPTRQRAVSAKEAKSLLADLGIDTAIRLRWAMRDIRGKRTKWSPISENDLAELIDLGLVEMREGIPALTDLGLFALD